MTTGKEVAVAEGKGLLMPVASPQQFLEAANAVTKIIADCLEDQLDYGEIPGNKNKTLLKPGAEKLCAAYGLVPNYSVIDSEIDHERPVTHKYGKSTGLYRYTVKCELHNRQGIPYGTGIASCSTMESKYVSRPRDCENTVLKMAQKRALVGAVLNCFSLSNRFTQDMDDIIENEKAAKSAPQKAPVYDKNNRKMQDALIAKLTEKEIPDSDWDEISDLLDGRPTTDLDQVLELHKGIKL